MLGSAGGSRLLRRTFLIAFILVSGGLMTSGAVELFFRYRESVERIGALQREMAQGVAFKIQQFVHDIEKTLRAATQTPEIVISGLTEAYRFQLTKLLREVPAATDKLPSRTLSQAGGGDIPIDPRDNMGVKAFVKIFLFDVELPVYSDTVNVGGRVYVRFDHGGEPLFWRWYREIRKLFLRRFNV